MNEEWGIPGGLCGFSCWLFTLQEEAGLAQSSNLSALLLPALLDLHFSPFPRMRTQGLEQFPPIRPKQSCPSKAQHPGAGNTFRKRDKNSFLAVDHTSRFASLKKHHPSSPSEHPTHPLLHLLEGSDPELADSSAIPVQFPPGVSHHELCLLTRVVNRV